MWGYLRAKFKTILVHLSHRQEDFLAIAFTLLDTEESRIQNQNNEAEFC